MATGTHRVIFIDLARAIAVVMMVYGHTVAALLAPQFQTGAWFDAWQFQRGLTSALFLLLSGFAFSVATVRRWPLHTDWSPAVARRLRRFAFYILLGYGMHFPVARMSDLPAAGPEQWRTFFAVDVLQLIGVSFLLLQALVLLLRSRRVFTLTAFAVAALLVAAAPAAWATDWSERLPAVVAAYLSPATGAQFPLVPWAAYVLIGAGVGQLYAHWGAGHLARFAGRALLAPGALLVVAALVSGPVSPGGDAGAFGWVPPLVMLRTGATLLLLGAIAHASRHITNLPHVFGAVAQESLVIYFFHLCIVYGSPWSPSLSRYFGGALSPVETLVVVVLLLGAMIALAWQWNRLKHVHPRASRWVFVATVAAGVILLL